MIVRPDPVESTAVAALADLTESFADLIQALGAGHGLATTRQDVLRRAQRCVPAGRHVALLLREDEVPRVCAATGEPARRAVAIEIESGEGPVLDALGDTDLVVSNDLLHDQRWPRFADTVFDHLRVRSLLACGIPLDRQRRAVLVYLSDWPYAFDDLTIATGRLLAQFCSLAALTT